ncbi:MAG: ribosome small subunit-dependent GTPase A [bacterium]|nr:ribosome small subunit-dependent GTPase A [bacterium]
MTGIIIKGIGGFYYVEAGGAVYECKARGVFRKKRITPSIGDRVDIELKNGKGSIIEIHERKTLLMRPAAANVDALMLVIAAASPDPNLFLADKMLINAEVNGIKPIICINKTDLAEYEAIKDIYVKAGYDVIAVSAEKDELADIMMPYLKGRTTAFAGLSGVGKSTILSQLTGGELETGEISGKIQRGKHTTRHVELFKLAEDTFVLDTPGFSSLEITDISDITESELADCFPEMAGVIGCRFRGCSHINEPDCAVKKKLEDGEIAPSRYESYKTLYEILKNTKKY